MSSFDLDLDSARPARLVLQKDAWDLIDPDTQQPLKDAAFDEFRNLQSSVSSRSTMAVQRSALADLILNLNAQSVASKFKSDLARNQFAEAWASYRFRFAREFSQLQTSLSRESQRASSAIYLSDAMIRKYLSNTLSDPQFTSDLQGVIGSMTEKLLLPQSIAINETFDFRVMNQNLQNQVIASAKLVALVDPKKVLVEPRSAISSSLAGANAEDPQLAKIHFRIPIRGIRILLPHFELKSSSLSKSLALNPEDQFEVEYAFDENQPIDGEIGMVWNSVTNLPDLVIDRKNIRLPLETMRLKYLKFRDQVFDPSEKSFNNWITGEPWRAVYGVLSDKKFLDHWVSEARTRIQNALSQMTSVDQNFNVFEQEGPVKIDARGLAESPYRIEKADDSHALSDRDRRALVASFHLRVDFTLSVAELNPGLESSMAAASPELKLKINSPRARVSDLRAYYQGHALNLPDLGLDVSLVSQNAEVLEARLAASLNLQKKSTAKASVSTNLEILGIDEFKLRMGTQVFTTDSPDLHLLLQNIEFFRSQVVSKDRHTEQPELGVSLQNAIVDELDHQFAARLSSTKIQVGPLKNDQGKVIREGFGLDQDLDLWKLKLKAHIRGLEGFLELPRIRLQNIRMEFADHSKSHPVCKGTYLISGTTHLGISDPMIIRGKNLKFALTTTLAGKPKTVDLSVREILAQVRQVDHEGLEKHSELDLGFDICYQEGRENLDIQMRSYSHNLDSVIFEDLSVQGVDVDQNWLNQVSGVLGYGSSKSSSRDARLTRLIQDIFIQQQTYISQQISDQLEEFFGEIIPKYLNSTDVKTKLDQGVAQLDQGLLEAVRYANVIGENLKKPLEVVLNNQADELIKTTVAPLLESQVDSRRNAFDESIIHIGRWLGADIEELIYTKFVEVLYGTSARESLSVGLERLLTPLSAQQSLKRSFGFSGLNPLDELRFRIRTMIQWNSIMIGLDACPFENSESSFQKLSRAMSQSSEPFDPATQAAVVKFVAQRCDRQSDIFLAGPAYLKDLYNLGLQSVNDFLIQASVRKFTSLPGSSDVPVLHGDKVSSNFETQWNISQVELLKDPAPVFRVLLKSPQFSTGLPTYESTVPPTVLNAIAKSDQNLIIRAPGSVINEMLMKIKWKDLIEAKLGSQFHIDLAGIPLVNDQGEILFSMKVKAEVGPFGILDITARMGGSLPFKIRLVKEESFGPLIQVQFDPLRLKELRANLGEGIIRDRLTTFNQSLTEGLNLAIRELGPLPKVSWLSNGFEAEDLIFDRGDFYFIAKRFDSPGRSELALH